MAQTPEWPGFYRGFKPPVDPVPVAGTWDVFCAQERVRFLGAFLVAICVLIRAGTRDTEQD